MIRSVKEFFGARHHAFLIQFLFSKRKNRNSMGLDQSKDCCDVKRIIKQKPKFPEGDFSVGFDMSAITPRNSTFMIHDETV
jgi:hypothetical protein